MECIQDALTHVMNRKGLSFVTQTHAHVMTNISLLTKCCGSIEDVTLTGLAARTLSVLYRKSRKTVRFVPEIKKDYTSCTRNEERQYIKKDNTSRKIIRLVPEIRKDNTSRKIYVLYRRSGKTIRQER